jgi:XTP/dITP diphosphohydrolase
MALPRNGTIDGVDPLRAAADTMRAVRDRCVWSQQIDHEALVPYLVEESAELIDAVESGTRDDLREELGDLLWQVLFHAEIASRDEDAPFDIDDVARGLTEKMVRRHPHVFAGAVARTPEEVLVHWNAAKAAEKRTRTSVLDGVSMHMPSLALAQKMLGKAAQVGVGVSMDVGASGGRGVSGGVSASADGAAPGSVGASVDGAAPEAVADAARSRLPADEEELGDALVALVALARERGWDAERAVRARLRRLGAEVRAAEAGRAAPRDV